MGAKPPNEAVVVDVLPSRVLEMLHALEKRVFRSIVTHLWPGASLAEAMDELLESVASVNQGRVVAMDSQVSFRHSSTTSVLIGMLATQAALAITPAKT